MRARTHLIRIQRALYDRLRGYARSFLGNLTPELRKYFREYQRDFHDFREPSTKQELLLALRKTHIAFCGDYHTLSQAQKTVIRVLRDALPALKRRDRGLILALEMVRASDNAKIQQYLTGKLSEAAFLKSIGFHRNWGFSWQNYRKLFQFAREHGIRVVGINRGRRESYPTLRERDRYAAEIIAALTERDENALILVLVGDLHLAHSHLPGELDRQLKRRGLERKRIVILQNNERFYWKLAQRGLEHRVDVVKVRENVFCVMNTPPWVKLRTHLKWTELIAEGGYGESAPIDYTELLQEIDYVDEIRELLQLIGKFLGEPAPADDDFMVRTPADRAVHHALLGRLSAERGWTQREKRVVTRCLDRFESFFVPRENIIYLTTLSINHASTQAAIYLHAKLSGFRRIYCDARRDFYAFVWVEALGFVGSKIINHKRKCDGPKDLERLVAKAGSGARGKRSNEEIAIARAALAHLEQEARYTPGRRFSGLSLPKAKSTEEQVLFAYGVARTLGQLLGQALYSAVIDNKVSREELRALFRENFSPLTARRLYLRWARRLDSGGYRSIVKAERL